jgi:hypothetical protein
VQIVWSSRRGSRRIEHLGSAHDESEVEAFKAAAQQRLAEGHSTLGSIRPKSLVRLWKSSLRGPGVCGTPVWRPASHTADNYTLGAAIRRWSQMRSARPAARKQDRANSSSSLMIGAPRLASIAKGSAISQLSLFGQSDICPRRMTGNDASSSR